MNLRFLTTTLCVTALCATLAGCSTAENVTQVVDGKVSFVVVEASGGGWGASKMAREAIESLNVADTLYMSGARATFTLKRGATVTEKQVASALESKKMKLVSFGHEKRPRPEVCFVATVTGLGWAQKAKRVREALVGMDGVIDVFVNQDIALQLTKNAKLDEKRLAELLAKEEVKVENVAPSGKYVL